MIILIIIIVIIILTPWFWSGITRLYLCRQAPHLLVSRTLMAITMTMTIVVAIVILMIMMITALFHLHNIIMRHL